MTSTWDPGFKSGNVTLSNGNLTAAFSASAGDVLCQRNMTGKSYFEVTVGSSVSATQVIGIANRSMGLGTLLGQDANGFSCGYTSAGVVAIKNSTVTTIQTFAATNVICVAVDIVGQLIWFRVGSGNWNNSGTANPATGAGGISLATMTTTGGPLGAVLPAVGANNASDTAVAAFASGSFTQSAPSGFDAIDTNQISASVNGDVANRSATFTQYGGGKRVTPSGPSIRGIQPPVWINGSGSISGTIEESGAGVSGRSAMLFDNEGRLIGSAVSASGGTYSIPALGRTAAFAVFFDPTNFQMIGFDRLTPG